MKFLEIFNGCTIMVLLSVEIDILEHSFGHFITFSEDLQNPLGIALLTLLTSSDHRSNNPD